MNKRIVVVLGLVLLARAGAGAVLPDKDIRAILADRIDVQRQGVGIVVGVIDPSGRRTVAYGVTNKGDGPVDADTVFEIGSVTKVFTSLLLADAVQRGEVALTDPVSKYLPPDVKVPERGGKKITLADLATHTSGLPRMPANFHPKDPGNPYADYTVAQLYEFLSSIELTRDIGSKYESQATGQRRFEIFAEGPRDFFIKEFDAQLTFVVDADGRTTGLVLHQNGRNVPANRIE